MRLRRSPLGLVLAGSTILVLLLLVGVVWALRSGWVNVEFPVLQRPAAAPPAATGGELPGRTSNAPVAEPTPENAADATRDGPPWVIQPTPPPGSRVRTGPLTVEAHGRGDAPITQIRLKLDDAAVPVTLDQRSESVWRGQASTAVKPGHHVVQAVVVQTDGKAGSYQWSFEAGEP
ncbi:MAG: hypothetical protein ACR2IK_08655 [Chloroflexota bacterium]